MTLTSLFGCSTNTRINVYRSAYQWTFFLYCLLTCFCHWLRMTTSYKRIWMMMMIMSILQSNVLIHRHGDDAKDTLFAVSVVVACLSLNSSWSIIVFGKDVVTPWLSHIGSSCRLSLSISERTPLERCCVHNMSPFVSSSGLSPGSREAKM